jgi:hypothetical protein
LIEASTVRTSRQTSTPDPSGSLGDQAGLADDDDVALGLEEFTQPAPDDLVVVQHENSDGSRSLHQIPPPCPDPIPGVPDHGVTTKTLAGRASAL